MSLFDDLASKVLSSVGGGSQGDTLQHVMSLVQQQGGVGAILQKFQTNGLGGIAQSWVGTGANQPVAPEQLQQVFGNEQLQALAQKAGIDPQQLSGILAQVLPTVVDKLTPNGQVPAAGEAQTGIASLLQKGLGGLFGS